MRKITLSLAIIGLAWPLLAAAPARALDTRTWVSGTGDDGNPCSRTVFDPLKTTNLPGSGAWVRGSIVQGSDLRPPLSIEIKVDGKKILAVRTE